MKIAGTFEEQISQLFFTKSIKPSSYIVLEKCSPVEKNYTALSVLKCLEAKVSLNAEVIPLGSSVCYIQRKLFLVKMCSYDCV